MAAKLVPGIRFLTSDTGVASAKVSALLMGAQYPIHIGSCVAVDHRRQTTIADFSDALDQLFAQFADSVSQLQRLLEIHLDYPINAMTRVCKKLALPKKASVEAIAMYEMAYGGGPADGRMTCLWPCRKSLYPQILQYSRKQNAVGGGKLGSRTDSALEYYDLAKAVDY